MKFDYLVKHNGVFYPAGMDVPVGAPVKVETTDNVPDGALKTNEDGSANVYNENGEPIGTVNAEEVEKLQEEAGEILQEQEKAKRSRKAKEQ